MRKTIQNALLKLLETTSINNISVKDITNNAKIHRSTFYVYFSNKNELYETIIEDTLYELEKAINPGSNLTFNDIEKLYKNNQDFLNEALLFVQHIQRNKQVYISLLKDIHFQERFVLVIHTCIMLGNILPDVYTKYLAYGAVGLVKEWLENEYSKSQEELAIYLTRMNIYALINYNAENKVKLNK